MNIPTPLPPATPAEIERLGEIARLAAEHDGTWDCKYRRAAAAVREEVLKGLHPSPPQPPAGYHLATDEERKCLPEGSMFWWDEYQNWFPRSPSLFLIAPDPQIIYACPDAPELVTFTDGKISPPPFGEWHRQDWTPEMLKGGYRPLMLGEPRLPGDQHPGGGAGWIPVTSGSPAHENAAGKTWTHTRTRRPLPEKPAEEWVPLGAEDVPPGSALRFLQNQPTVAYWMIRQVSQEGVTLNNDQWEWVTLALEPFEILRPGQTWQPCKKPAPKP